MAFITMCEGYLGIKPHFELWRYFFSISLIKKKDRGRETPVPMGCVGIHLRGQRLVEYMPCQLSRSKKGWHLHWFYQKNDPAAPLLVFSGRLIEEVPPLWPWGPPIKEKKRMRDLLEAITFLKTHGLYGASIIGGVSCEEGGTTDGARPPPIRDDAQRVAHWDYACPGAAP